MNNIQVGQPGSRLVVLIPVYDDQSGLELSLSSLRDALGTFDVLVVDDGSPEPVTIPDFLRADISVYLIRAPQNRGITFALNCGLEFTLERGYEFIARLDAGDTIAPHRFQAQIEVLDGDPSCAAVSSFVDFVDEQRRFLFRHETPCDHPSICRTLRVKNCLLHTSVTLRTSAVAKVGPYNSAFALAEDYELFLRLSHQFRLAAVPEVLTFTSYDPNGLSVRYRREQSISRLRLQLRFMGNCKIYAAYCALRTIASLLVPHFIVFRWKRTWNHA